MHAVGDLIELRRRARDVVEPVEQRLEAGVALRVPLAGLCVRPAGVFDGAVVDLHRAARIVDVAGEVGKRLRGHRRLASRLGEELDLVPPAGQCLAARERGISQRGERLLGRGGEPRQVERQPVEPGRRPAQVGEQRGLGARKALERHQRRIELREEVVEQLEVAREILPPRRGCRGGVLRLVDEADHVLARSRELTDHAVRVDAQVADDPVLVGEDPGGLLGFRQRRRSEPDRLVQSLRVARQSGAEFVDQELESFPVRLAERVLNEVRLHGLGDPAGRDGPALGHRFARGVAIDEVLGDQ